MRPLFRRELTLLWALVALIAVFTGQSRATETAIVLENRTYSPLHYRGTTAQGTRQAWKVLLPGGTAEHSAGMRGIEVWFNDSRTDHYRVTAGNVYAWHRSTPRGRPEFSNYARRFQNAPTPPQRPLYGEDAFAPLERFITQCEERKHDYRLSLQQLARDCAAAQQKGPLPDELRFVRGFTWFFGFMIDDENQDVILLGVKDPTRPPIDVDSLATVIKAVTANQVPLCSLEEHADSRYKKSIVQGVPWNTRFAEVMIKADYDMGRTFQGGLQPNIPGFKDWMDHFEDVMTTIGEAPEGYDDRNRNGGSRWWFNLNSDVARAVADPSGQLLYLHTNPVRLSTERKVNGKFGSGQRAESAVRFAEQFNDHLDALGKEYPSIGELQCLFRLYDLMRHVHELGKAAVPEGDYWIKHYRHPYAGPAETMPAGPKVSRIIRARKDVPRFLPGSTFIGTEVGYGPLRFDLFTSGRVTLQDGRETKYGTWETEGERIVMRFYNGRVVYVGSRLEGGVVGGAASSQGTWTWTTDRGYETQNWTQQ
jgi:hypothetical protein